MPNVTRPAVRLIACSAIAVMAAACSDSGTTSPLSGGGAGGGDPPDGGRDLRVLASDPGDQDVQVPVDAALSVEFDGELAIETLDLPGTGLYGTASGQRIATAVAVVAAGTTAVFRPLAPLDEETDHQLRFDPLTSDLDGRVLDRDLALSFRTVDDTPPTVVGWSYDGGAHRLGPESPIVVTFDESVDPATVSADGVGLRHASGASVRVDLEVDGRLVTCTPWRDVSGSLDFVIAVRGVADRSGNRIAASWSARARTPVDITPPTVVHTWPTAAGAISPWAAPRVRFSESVAVAVGESGFGWYLESGATVAFTPVLSRDGRTVHLVPDRALAPGSRSRIKSDPDDAPIADVSGNVLGGTVVIDVLTGTDREPPGLASSSPAYGGTRVPPYAAPTLLFDEVLDPDFVDRRTVVVERADGTPIAGADVVLDGSGSRVTVRPAAPLEAGAVHLIRLRGGLDGLRDPAGNRLAEDLLLPFTVNPDRAEPLFASLPAPDAIGVALDATLVAMASIPLDPATVGEPTVSVVDDRGETVHGTISLEAGDRAIRFAPAGPWTAGARFTLVVSGGADGVRAANGNWLREPLRASFRVGYRTDATPPRAMITLDGIRGDRAQDRCVPPHGFSIEVGPADGSDPTFDPSSVELTLEAAGQQLATDGIAARATAVGTTMRFWIPADHPLPVGAVVVRAVARDLSGNASDPVSLAVGVAMAAADLVPFERTQVVWVRFDLDRDGNGHADFADDLLRLGLAAEGDPLGSNADLAAVVRDGVLARCRTLFGRSRSGAPLGPDSVAIRVTDRRPQGVAHMQIACGGFDPEGPAGRRFGDASTGTLGRAWFDFRNAESNEQNISVDPGLGVFPAELWLFEARAHQQLYPAFVTAFAERFIPLAPALGGVAAGTHTLDPVALGRGFDPATGSAAAVARWQTIFRAADDWATAVGTILSHEVGHTVGLTASGTGADGLHGDASLHNIGANTTDVMAAAIGFDAMVSLDFHFRDLNVAYLRHRVLLR